MPSFKQRSYQKELLDRDDIPFEDIKKNMQELDVINQMLGGHRITLHGMKGLFKHQQKDNSFNVVEIGCGGGDNLRVVRKWASQKQIRLQLTGVDINPACISFANGLTANKGISFVCSDYKNMRFDERPDIIFSSLFCHHFTDEELASMLQWMQENSTKGFFINDLHRHPVAYYSILLLTKIFSRSRLVKNDAPLSVQRGFKKKDWTRLFHEAQISSYNCRWMWAFRWLITYRS